MLRTSRFSLAPGRWVGSRTKGDLEMDQTRRIKRARLASRKAGNRLMSYAKVSKKKVRTSEFSEQTAAPTR
jgi:hypothetical protein